MDFMIKHYFIIFKLSLNYFNNLHENCLLYQNFIMVHHFFINFMLIKFNGLIIYFIIKFIQVFIVYIIDWLNKFNYFFGRLARFKSYKLTFLSSIKKDNKIYNYIFKFYILLV
jgi:hypothetical protein